METLATGYAFQVALFSAFPLVISLVRSNVRQILFFVYLGMVLTVGGLAGQIWAVEFGELFRLSGGNVAYGGFMMAALLFAILEGRASIVRCVIYLVVLVNVFVYTCFNSIAFFLDSPEFKNPHGVPAAMFEVSGGIVISGGILIIVELLLCLAAFGVLSRPKRSTAAQAALAAALFVGLMVLDGVLFPLVNFHLFPDPGAVIAGGLPDKIALGLSFAPVLFALLLLNRQRLSAYLGAPVGVRDVFSTSSADMVEIIDAQSAALRASEAHYRSLVEDQPDLICRFEPDTTLTFVNRAYADYFGETPDALVGRPFMEFLDATEQRAITEHLSTFTPDAPVHRAEQMTTAPDGTPHWHVWTNRAIFSPDGELLSFQAIGQEITERREIEARLRRSQKLEAVGQLTGGIAHDFNNILNVVMGNLELLQRRVGDDRRSAKFVESALVGVDRGASLTNKLLSFSRHAPAREVLVRPSETIEDIRELIAQSLTAAVSVRTDFAADEWSVRVDDGDLQDALVNVALNARDAMSSAGTLSFVTRNVHLSSPDTGIIPAIEPGDYVLIKVSDTGVGMSANVLEKIFDPFYSTKELGKGTGLGLSMVYGFVERSAGGVQVRSEPGSGTEVAFYLPRATDRPEDSPHPTDETPLPSGTERILVVDDEQQLANLACMHLEDLGYSTRSATSAEQAMAILREDSSVELLFSDVVMPGGVDGFRLAREARELRPDLPVLLTSGFTVQGSDVPIPVGKEDEDTLRQRLLRKPYTVAALARAVRKALDAVESGSAQVAEDCVDG